MNAINTLFATGIFERKAELAMAIKQHGNHYDAGRYSYDLWRFEQARAFLIGSADLFAHISEVSRHAEEIAEVIRDAADDSEYKVEIDEHGSLLLVHAVVALAYALQQHNDGPELTLETVVQALEGRSTYAHPELVKLAADIWEHAETDGFDHSEARAFAGKLEDALYHNLRNDSTNHVGLEEYAVLSECSQKWKRDDSDSLESALVQALENVRGRDFNGCEGVMQANGHL